MNLQRRFVGICLLAIWLAGCSGGAAIPTTTAVPTQSTPAATGTTAVTTAPTPSDTPEDTPVPTLEPTAVMATLQAVRQPGEVQVIKTRDGQWQAELTVQFCAAAGNYQYLYHRLRIQRGDGSQSLTLLEELQVCALGYVDVVPIGWSANSRYFYYIAREVSDGGECIQSFQSKARQFDVKTGQTGETPGAGPLSPDASRMVWPGVDGLVEWDLNNSQQAGSVALPEAGKAVVGLAWGDDSRTIYALLLESACPPFGKSTLLQMDVKGKAEVLFESESPRYVFLWRVPGETGRLHLGAFSGESWILDLKTRRLEPSP